MDDDTDGIYGFLLQSSESYVSFHLACFAQFTGKNSRIILVCLCTNTDLSFSNIEKTLKAVPNVTICHKSIT